MKGWAASELQYADLGDTRRNKRHKKLTHDKESQRWLSALDATGSLISHETVVVTVADREADIYDLWVLPRRPNSHLLRKRHSQPLC